MQLNGNGFWHQAASADELASTLAQSLAEQIARSIEQKGSAVLALSGGSTPKPLFKALGKLPIDWSKVLITLVDERWVDSSHELSNEAFMQRYLLGDLTSEAQFISLYQAAESAQHSLKAVLTDYCLQTNSSIDAPREFDVVVLGMGGDGHTASFFPDADNIAAMLNPMASDYLFSCESPSTQVERITWSLPMLLSTSLLALHITGKDKKAVFERALENGDSLEQISRLPIRSVLFQDQTPFTVYYAD